MALLVVVPHGTAEPAGLAKRRVAEELWLGSASPLCLLNATDLCGGTTAKRSIPLVTVVASNEVMVTAVDSMGQFVVWQIKDDQPSRLALCARTGLEQQSFCSLPVVLVQSEKLAMVVVKKASAENWVHLLSTSMFNPTTKQFDERDSVVLTQQDHFHRGGRYRFEGIAPIYPALNSVLVLGIVWDTYRFYGPFLVPDPPNYRKNWTMLISGGTNLPLRRVAPKGRWDVDSADYAVGHSGIVHSVWLQDNERVLYNFSVAGGPWSKPLELYPKESRGHRGSVVDASVTCFSNTAYVMWVVGGEGVYVAEIVQGKSPDAMRIGGCATSLSIGSAGINHLGGAPCSDIAMDSGGSAYAVWAWDLNLQPTKYNAGEHRFFLRVRTRAGGWMREVLLSEGAGFIRSPSIVIDQWGHMHVAYLRELGRDEFGCFYRKFGKDVNQW